MDLSKSKIVGYFGAEPIYLLGSDTGSEYATPPQPAQAVEPQPENKFCLTCLMNEFIDVVEEHIDPYLDQCKERLQQLGQVRIDSDETALWVMTERQALLKTLAFGSEVSANLQALITTAATVFGTEEEDAR